MTKRFITTALAGAAALLLAGCSLMPDLRAPGRRPVPATFPDAAAAPTAPGQPPAATVAWQDFFADARLQQLIELALANNRDLRVVDAQHRAGARAVPDHARGPVARRSNASASGTRQRPSLLGGSVSSRLLRSASASRPGSSTSSAASRSLKDAALAQYLATEEARKAAQISLIAAVANAWLHAARPTTSCWRSRARRWPRARSRCA